MPLSPTNKVTKKQAVASWLVQHGESRVGLDDWRELKQTLGPTSDQYLRKLLRASGHGLDPLVEGVRQENLEALADSLTRLESVYTAGSLDVKKSCRALVIEAKQHASFAEKRTGKAEKKEMLEWMRVWLENPAVFPVWVEVRKKAI